MHALSGRCRRRDMRHDAAHRSAVRLFWTGHARMHAGQRRRGGRRTDLSGGHEVEVEDAPARHGGVDQHERVLVQVHGRQQLLALPGLGSPLGRGLDLVHDQLAQVGQDALRAGRKRARLARAEAAARMHAERQ